MKEILIQEVSIKNYRSFKDVTVTFPSIPGLRMLAGENKTNPRLGSNGGGKSSFWDAIEWCLHATSVQGSKISDTLSWGTEHASVTLKLLIAGQENTIHRYGPPVKVELNGTPVEQPAIDTLIGLSKLRFLHSVIFGQEQKLFPDLAVPERGALLDEVLNLSIWQKATEAASTKHGQLEKALLEKKSEVTYVRGSLAALTDEKYVENEIAGWELNRNTNIASVKTQAIIWKTTNDQVIADLEKQKEEWKVKLLKQIEDKAIEIENLEAELAPIKYNFENAPVNAFGAQLAGITESLSEIKAFRDTYTANLHRAEHERASCIAAEGFWLKNECPVCAQSISPEKKKRELELASQLKAKLTKDIEEASKSLESVNVAETAANNEFTNLHSVLAADREKTKAVKKEVDRLQSQINICEHEGKRLITEFDNNANPYETQIKQRTEQQNPYAQQERSLLTQINPFIDKLERLKQERSRLQNELVAKETQYNQLEAKMTAAEFWRHGFKRIRLFFVQQILATLEVEIQSAISSLGLDGWHVGLATESETKSQTIKLGVAIHIKSPEAAAKWEVWCGGEKQRLRLGIASGLASLIQRAAGVWWGLEVYDEPTRSLSPQGVEDLLESLRYRAEALKKQIFITDHSNIQYAAFEEIWTAIKDQNGSRIEKVYQEA